MLATLFTVIAASRPMNKNVSSPTGAVIRAKPATKFTN